MAASRTRFRELNPSAGHPTEPTSSMRRDISSIRGKFSRDEMRDDALHSVNLVRTNTSIPHLSSKIASMPMIGTKSLRLFRHHRQKTCLGGHLTNRPLGKNSSQCHGPPCRRRDNVEPPALSSSASISSSGSPASPDFLRRNKSIERH